MSDDHDGYWEMGYHLDDRQRDPSIRALPPKDWWLYTEAGGRYTTPDDLPRQVTIEPPLPDLPCPVCGAVMSAGRPMQKGDLAAYACGKHIEFRVDAMGLPVFDAKGMTRVWSWDTGDPLAGEPPRWVWERVPTADALERCLAVMGVFNDARALCLDRYKSARPAGVRDLTMTCGL